MDKNLQKTHVSQQGQSDCGVACLKAALQHFGGNASLERLRELSGTTPQGTTMLGLVQAGQSLGLDTEGYEVEDMDNLKTCTDLCILHVLIDQTLQHYIVCYGFDTQKQAFIIGDPAKPALEMMSTTDLEKIWQSKALLMVKPTPKLQKVVETQSEKWSWLVGFVRQDGDILLVAAVLGIVLAVLSLATALFSQKLVDVILPAKDQFRLISGCALLFVLLLARGFLGYLRQLLMLRQSQSFNTRLIDYFYSSLLNLPKSFFDSRKTGELVARMNDTQRIQNTISMLVGSSTIDILLVIVATVSIFNYDLMLGSIALLWLPIVAWIAFRFHPKIVQSQTSVMQSYARSESNYIETIQGVGEIKINNRQPFFTDLTRNIYGAFQQNIVALGKIGGRYGLWTETVATLFIAVVTLLSSLLVLRGALTTGAIIAVLQIIGMLMSSVNRLAVANIQIQEAKIAFERMSEFTQLNDEFSAENDMSKSIISGGQTQLVGIARALWTRLQLLLLDEPTAALDRDSEQFVIQLLQRIKHETAVLILTHRLSIVKGAERIYILKNGQIEEEGNHVQLLQKDNLYSRSWLDWKAA